MRYKLYRKSISFAAALAIVACASSARAQQSTDPNARPDERQAVGTVSSSGRGSLVVQTDEGKINIYTLDPSLLRIPKLPPGERVRVITSSSDTDPAPTVLAIDTFPPRAGLAEYQPQPVPADVRRLQAELERQAKRYHFGASLGMALDPELLSMNGFATFSPFSQRGILFRPNLEVAFGEITSLIGVHLDVVYTLSGLTRTTRWVPYVGAGPNFSFSHRSVEEEQFLSGDAEDPDQDTDPAADEDDDGGRFDFSQFDWDNGFNFIIGARTPKGAFFEMKATAWGVASIRMLGGFAF